MNSETSIELIDRLRSFPSETEWLDFKHNHVSPHEIGEYLSALANEAALLQQPRGYLLFGIDDKSHAVIPTSFDPYTAKASGNQDLQVWLSAHLKPNPGFEFVAVDHPDGRVVIGSVGASRDQPTSFDNVAYCRSGASKTKLSNHPEKQRSLWTRGSDWSSEICVGAQLSDLDPTAIEMARQQFRIKHPTQFDELEQWDDETFLNKAKVLRKSAITNSALLLLGRSESAALLAPHVARISWVLKDDTNKELDYEHIGLPLIQAGDQLLTRIRNLTVRAMPSGTLFPNEITQYDPWVLREALHNCIAHQDYRLQSRITVVEFPDRIVIANVGQFLPGDVQTVIEQDSPQLQYRNPFLAHAMVELNMIDTQGGGIKRMFETQRQRSFPMPDYDLNDPGKVAVSISGQILNERYTQLLMQQQSLSLAQVIHLDSIQKKRQISRDAYKQLKAAGLVEGRYPNIYVAGIVAKATGHAAQHIRQRGMGKQYYLDIILELVREHGPIGRSDLDLLLLDKLPERLTQVQKRSKVQNLIQELRRSGQISNKGTRSKPAWVLTCHE